MKAKDYLEALFKQDHVQPGLVRQVIRGVNETAELNVSQQEVVNQAFIDAKRCLHNGEGVDTKTLLTLPIITYINTCH